MPMPGVPPVPHPHRAPEGPTRQIHRHGRAHSDHPEPRGHSVHQLAALGPGSPESHKAHAHLEVRSGRRLGPPVPAISALPADLRPERGASAAMNASHDPAAPALPGLGWRYPTAPRPVPVGCRARCRCPSTPGPRPAYDASATGSPDAPAPERPRWPCRSGMPPGWRRPHATPRPSGVAADAWLHAPPHRSAASSRPSDTAAPRSPDRAGWALAALPAR